MYKNLKSNITQLQSLTGGSADFTVRTFKLNNTFSTECAVFTTEGMCNKETLAISVINPILKADYGNKVASELFDYIFNSILSASEIVVINSFDEVLNVRLCCFGS
jgi:spore germination protein KA